MTNDVEVNSNFPFTFHIIENKIYCVTVLVSLVNIGNSLIVPLNPYLIGIIKSPDCFFSLSVSFFFANSCGKFLGADNPNNFEVKMSALPPLTKEPTYQKLQEWFNANGNNLNIKSLFESDPARFDKFR